MVCMVLNLLYFHQVHAFVVSPTERLEQGPFAHQRNEKGNSKFWVPCYHRFSSTNENLRGTLSEYCWRANVSCKGTRTKQGHM